MRSMVEGPPTDVGGRLSFRGTALPTTPPSGGGTPPPPGAEF